AAHRAADLHLQCAVPALPAGRRERVERAPLVQVNQPEALPGRAAEAHHRAQQLRAEAARLQRAVHRVQVRDQALQVVRGVTADQPGEAVGVLAQLRLRLARAHAEQLGDLLLDVAEGPALGGTEADRAG